MTSETDWLDSLISSHKQKLAEIKQWQVPPYQPNNQSQQINYDQSNTYHRFQYPNPNENQTTPSPSIPSTSQCHPITTPILSSSSLSSDISILTRKVARQKTKITSLKSSLAQLTEENTCLKSQLYHLENYTQSMSIDQKKSYYNQTSSIQNDQTLLYEIETLKENITSLEAKLSKITRLDDLKSHDIELLNQKVRDMETIMEENGKDSALTIGKLKEENEALCNQLNEVDKVFELFNYFVKRMSSIYPHNIRQEEINYGNIRDFQDRLIQIENCIVDEKNKMCCHLKGVDDEHYQNVLKLNQKIDMLSKENEEMEQKLKENVVKEKTIGSPNSKLKKGLKGISKKYKK